jgi:hypothetical protein
MPNVTVSLLLLRRPIFVFRANGGIPGFIKTLYQNILNRDVEIQEGIDYWTEQTRFHGIAPTIATFFTCNEFLAQNHSQEVVVDKLYSSILGREGRGDGRNYWLDRLGRGDGIEMIVNDFLRSAEYREKARHGVVPSPGMSVYPAFLFAWKISLVVASQTYIYMESRRRDI